MARGRRPLHNIWLRLSEQAGVGSKLHHRDVVGVALQRLDEELQSAERLRILKQVESAVHRHEGELEIAAPL